MSKYKYLMFDIDNTILSFDKAELAALKTLFEKYGFGEFTSDRLQRYHDINRRYWADIEKGKIEKKSALERRFIEFFETEGLDPSKAGEFNINYQLALGDTIAFCDNGFELLKEWKKSFTLLAVTNGTRLTQNKKLRLSGLDRIFDDIFISEEIGYEKPDIRFFEFVRKKIGLENFDKCLLIGDTLNSDIKGGNNAEIKTIWYNPKGKINETDAVPDAEIRHLSEINAYI